MSEAADRLALPGHWQRDEAPPCAARYAARLTFLTSGLYEGESEPPGEFTWWDRGTWEVKADSVLALSVANDEVIDYRYTLDAGRLRLTDRDGCSVGYRRVG